MEEKKPSSVEQKKAPPKRAKCPTVLQMEAVECGAASLAIVMGYFNRIEPLEKLRVECGVSRDGSKASNVLKVARKYGLESKGLRKEPEALRDFEPPMIIHWNFNHFLVLEGFKADKVFLNDPGSGPRVVTYEEFDASYTGIVLTFKKGPEFKPGGKKPSIFTSLGSRLSKYKQALTYVILVGLCLVIPGLAIPIFSRVFVDDYLVGGMASWIKPLLLGMGLTALLRLILSWMQEYYLLRFETKLALSESSKFLWHILRLPIEFFSQRFPGDVSGRVAINDKVASLLSGEMATTAINLLMVFFYAALLFTYDWMLALVGVIMALINVALLRYVSRKRVDRSQKMLQEHGKLMGVSMGGLQAIETLKATGRESDFFEKWAGHQTKVTNALQELAQLTIPLSIVPPMLMTLNNTAILGLGGVRVMSGHLSMGMLVAFQSLMTSFMMPFNQMVDLGGRVQELEGDMNRLDDIYRYRIDHTFSSNDKTKNYPESKVKLSGEIELKNVTFGYSRLDPPLIENFSFCLKPGQRVALVGGSGCGKSTIAKLITGQYQPWDGAVMLDGVPRDEIPRHIIINSLAMVDQDIFLFKAAVNENLKMWDNTIPEKNVVMACNDACIHEDVAARSGGYDSEVNEMGVNFSGGQRQRLEIARALVNNPAILVLDEATSALDPKTEKLIDDNLRRRGCTCVIVAHRLSTIRDCDEIIVLSRGKVIQRGTHNEMKDAEGPYAQLIKMH